METRIRRYKKDDIRKFYEAGVESKGQLSEWLPWCNENYSIENSRQWILDTVPKIWKSNTGYEFIIELENTQEVVGGCCLEQVDRIANEANIGYWVRSNYTKKGIATTACEFLLKFGFERLGLDRINVIPSVLNIASTSVAEKLPYTEKLLVKDGFKIKDKTSDALVFTITQKSWLHGS